jgi:hypothetical protein
MRANTAVGHVPHAGARLNHPLVYHYSGHVVRERAIIADGRAVPLPAGSWPTTPMRQRAVPWAQVLGEVDLIHPATEGAAALGRRKEAAQNGHQAEDGNSRLRRAGQEDEHGAVVSIHTLDHASPQCHRLGRRW